MDEPIDDGWNAELAHPTATLRDLVPPHCEWLVRAGEQSLTQRRPVHPQVIRQLIHRHPVDAGAALVLPHSFQRGL